MRTIAAFDPGLFAHSLRPFIGANRLIARLSRPSALEAAWIDVFAPTKEGMEKSDLRFRRRSMIDNPVVRDLDRELFEDHRPAHHLQVNQP